MKNKQLKNQSFPMLLATGVLSTGLLLSGCSNSDNDTDDTATAASVQEQESANQDAAASLNDTDTIDKEDINDDLIANDSGELTATPDNDADNVINPTVLNAKQPSLVNNPTQAGTAEDTVKQALNTLYYGDVKEAAKYYKVDMANFADELAKTQYAFQQTVEGVTITNTKYNEDKTRATISGELQLKDQDQPAPLTYELQKIDGQWKILG